MSTALAAAQPSVAADAAETPSPAIRGVYVSASTAGDPTAFGRILEMIDRTELNAVVVDVKTDWGNISFQTDEPLVKEVGATHAYIPDIGSFLETLRVHRVYRIARVVAFKDVPAVAAHPEWGLPDVNGGPWKDSNGMTWLNPRNKGAWEYLVAVGRAAAKAGFDEVQYDYVRFPTDGDLDRIVYPSDGRSKQEIIAGFLAYARQELHKEGIQVSADVFGLVTSFSDDMGIGQHLEDVAGAVDYVSPMLYPSHYTRGNLGIPNPNAAPYQTVYRSLQDARGRLAGAGLTDRVDMRAWLQDFSMGYHYGPAEVSAEIQAVRDAGYTQWLLWNAANEYTEAALAPKNLAADDPFALPAREVGATVTVALNGQVITAFDPQVAPFLSRISGRTLVPLRTLTEALGAQVEWEGESRTAIVRYNGHTVRIPIGSRTITVDGTSLQLDQGATLWHSRTMVPVRFVTQALGATVTWDGTAGRVDVNLPGAVCAPGYCQN